MKISPQELSILMLYYLGYSKARNFFFQLKHKAITKFITFHDLLPDEVSSFRKKIDFLKNHTNVVSIDDFFSGILSLKKVNVVITFDDGYKSWSTYVVPILKAFELPAIFFISSGFIDLSKKEEIDFINNKLFRKLPPRKISGCLNSDDVKMISEEAFNIGGHTLNHCDLSKLCDSNQIKSEIFEDKAKLEMIIGKEIKYFSYPSGDFFNPSINIVSALKGAGYIGAVTTLPGFNNNKAKPYFLKRDLTHASMRLNTFKARIYGNYDPIIFIKKIQTLLNPKQ